MKGSVKGVYFIVPARSIPKIVQAGSAGIPAGKAPQVQSSDAWDLMDLRSLSLDPNDMKSAVNLEACTIGA